MTSNEFISWLKGFAAAKRNDQITAADWGTIVEELTKVEQPATTSTSVGTGGYGVTTTYLNNGNALVTYTTNTLDEEKIL